jgi:hypothetical protein
VLDLILASSELVVNSNNMHLALRARYMYDLQLVDLLCEVQPLRRQLQVSCIPVPGHNMDEHILAVGTVVAVPSANSRLAHLKEHTHAFVSMLPLFTV